MNSSVPPGVKLPTNLDEALSFPHPPDLSGLQRLEAPETVVQFGDVWVLDGKPTGWATLSAEKGITVEFAEKNFGSGRLYRYNPVPKPGGLDAATSWVTDDKGKVLAMRIAPPTDTKPTNPKDAIGSDKVPLHLFPTTAKALGAMALLDGALKYGRSNFREVGVRASIYYDAANRHLDRWFEGEDTDPDSGLPHLAHVLACVAILVDAKAAGKLNDDRMVAGGFENLLKEITPHVKRLKEEYADRDPKHYTIQDSK